MKIAYFDCFSGISGDMVLGALLDLGLPVEVLLEELQKLPVEGYSLQAGKEKRGAVRGSRVTIQMEPQPSRTYADIERLIQASHLTPSVKKKSLGIFERLARAEARVHGMDVSHVHFHEVGALDSILDVVGSVIGLEYLGIEKIYASRIPLGSGLVQTQHGTLPLPAPATVLLLEGAPVYDSGIPRELVTPTGAAILSSLAESYGTIPDMVLESTGYGVGAHPASDPPNLLRILCGTPQSPYRRRDLLLVETHIDDMNPELYGHVCERLFQLGALDVALLSLQMKKNRPGTCLRVLLEPGHELRILDALFSETTTLGVRVQDVKRVELPRESREIPTPYGWCRVKAVTLPGGAQRLVPEYDACKHIADTHGVPLREVYETIYRVSGEAETSRTTGGQ